MNIKNKFLIHPISNKISMSKSQCQNKLKTQNPKHFDPPAKVLGMVDRHLVIWILFDI